jgi:hypothetical protein
LGPYFGIVRQRLRVGVLPERVEQEVRRAAVPVAEDRRRIEMLGSEIKQIADRQNSSSRARIAANSLVNVSMWRRLEDAEQLDTFQPMLDLGKVFVTKGASFERPIMNYTSLWEIAP